MPYCLLHDILAIKDNLNSNSHVHSKNVMSTSQWVGSDSPHRRLANLK